MAQQENPNALDLIADELEKKDREERLERAGYLLRGSITLVFYPLEYARTLMQLGYEPYPPSPSVSLFHRPCLLLPNVIQYIKHIRETDGILGCYRGVYPYCVSKAIYMFAYEKFQVYLKSRFPEEVENDNEDEPVPIDGGDDRRIQTLNLRNKSDKTLTLKKLCHTHGIDLVCRITGIVISYPFHTVAVSCMAAFIGREKQYSLSPLLAMETIYKTQGISGLYKGLFPRICGEALNGIVFGSLWYVIKNRVNSSEIQTCLRLSLSVLTGALTYPFQVVSKIMMINGTGLKLSRDPYTPEFDSWIQCWYYLQENNQLRRGSSYFYRTYTGPTTFAVGGLRPRRDVVFGNPPRIVRI